MDIKKAFRPAEVLWNEQVDEIERLTDAYVELANSLNRMPESREKSLCLTKLQESKFFMCECIAKNPDRDPAEDTVLPYIMTETIEGRKVEIH